MQTCLPAPPTFLLQSFALVPSFHSLDRKVEILAKGVGKTEEEVERDISRPRYFTPYQAVEYGIIDKVCAVSCQS